MACMLLGLWARLSSMSNRIIVVYGIRGLAGVLSEIFSD